MSNCTIRQAKLSVAQLNMSQAQAGHLGMPSSRLFPCFHEYHCKLLVTIMLSVCRQAVA